MDHVMVETHLALGQRADRLTVLADVRDHHDAGQDFGISLREELWGPAWHALLAEIAGDADQVLLRQLLVGEDDDDVVEPGLIDRLDRVLVGLLAQVKAPNLSPDMRGQRNDIEASLGHDGHWRCSPGTPEGAWHCCDYIGITLMSRGISRNHGPQSGPIVMISCITVAPELTASRRSPLSANLPRDLFAGCDHDHVDRGASSGSDCRSEG